MKFGLKVINSGPGASPETMKRWTQFAETVGMHYVMVADHITVTPDVQDRYPAPYYEPFTNMAWLAALTEKVEIGVSVIVVPYRDPLYTAQLVANLDQLSGGRIIFGVGVGWAEREFEALGVTFRKRGAITNDYLSAMKAVWSGEMTSYEGPHVSFRDVAVTPAPVQKPHPPIWVGGSSPGAFRRAVRLGDAWHPIGPQVDWLRNEGLPTLKRVADEEGLPVPAFCPRIWCRITDSPLPEDTRIMGEGTLDQVRSDLVALEEMGAEYVMLDTRRNSPTAGSPTHHEEGWNTITTLIEHVIDLDGQTVR